MNYRLVVRPQVDDDLLEAESWYNSKQPGLGREFVAAVREAISRLRQNPLIYRSRHLTKHVRWVYPRRFPYRIVFRVIADTIVIYAILHAARHDREWQRRV